MAESARFFYARYRDPIEQKSMVPGIEFMIIDISFAFFGF